MLVYAELVQDALKEIKHGGEMKMGGIERGLKWTLWEMNVGCIKRGVKRFWDEMLCGKMLWGEMNVG